MPVVSGIAFVLFVNDLITKNQKIFLWIAFALWIASPFTYGLSGILSLIFFAFIFRAAHNRFFGGELKIKSTVPCPFCNKEIPKESTGCPYCNTPFRKREPESEKDFFN
jgi:hypothetical protein